MKENTNIRKFAVELGYIVDQHIGLDHIHPSTGCREYYIQSPKVGAPMLLKHYRGPFFVDIHPDDYDRITNGEISAHEYILSANWQIGYYQGGGSMVGGGYYQPFDIISRKAEVRRYFKIISCRVNSHASGYMPTKEVCAECSVKNCPVSYYKKGNWDKEIPEVDPRCKLFDALVKRFEEEHPDYTLRGFLCGSIPDDEIRLSPNRPRSGDPSFTAYASNSVIQSLLIHEIMPENWEEYAGKFKFCIHKMFDSEVFDATKENVEKAFAEMDHMWKKS